MIIIYAKNINVIKKKNNIGSKVERHKDVKMNFCDWILVASKDRCRNQGKNRKCNPQYGRRVCLLENIEQDNFTLIPHFDFVSH